MISPCNTRARVCAQDPEKIGIVLTFLSVTVVGQVTPLGALSVRLVQSQGPRAGERGPALVVTREPKEQITPFPGQSAYGGVLWVVRVVSSCRWGGVG